MDPDPVLERIKPGYLDKMATEADSALQVSERFTSTGRVCAACSVALPKKMRRCPCKGAYYCGPECQREHWRSHRAVCAFRKTD